MRRRDGTGTNGLAEVRGIPTKQTSIIRVAQHPARVDKALLEHLVGFDLLRVIIKFVGGRRVGCRRHRVGQRLRAASENGIRYRAFRGSWMSQVRSRLIPRRTMTPIDAPG
jgi:hypothetical protein